MYWWNTKALINNFRENKLSERDKYKYLIIFLVLRGAPFLAFFAPRIKIEETQFLTNMPILFSTALILGIIIRIGGILLCYKANQKGDDKDFIERYVAISLPLSLRLTAYLVIPLVLVTLTCAGCYSVRGYDLSISGMLIYFEIIGVAFSIFYYLLMWAYIGEISGADDPTRQIQTK